MNIAIAKYFNGKGRCIYELGFEKTGQSPAPHTESMRKKQAAHGVQALIALVVGERVGIDLARKVRTVAIDDLPRVSISEALPELEREFGATSVQWAHAIFTHLKLQPPSLQ